ncbi:LysR substrate-binding domain-containing protein [Bradyrhizobium sp. GCM10027634]|uniref:LysR substrate-binding domain-containing protein n=1 Tax=unclassified Bradyrhizobium TaxID=2631580 RepID=UPI00188D9523|nr:MULTISPECIES: LysR substrate-binding domain-containing protein [unclassified Bradyrhizobium]MDN5000754.1 LysR substrate-binding domain-containing protein [Bradyrhizobium sp. WYCCWR 12677]QOZ42527.1 LysR family transcriptional regulator [Bradyrhizobium sp. CCBAU 53340]
MGTVDDLTLLVEIIEAGSLSAASRKTGIPKSSLSRRIGDLESQLGVHLVHRGPRNFSPTEIGLSIYERGQKIREELVAIKALAEDRTNRPSGMLRISCPAVLSEILVTDFAIQFAETYPDVRLTLDNTKGTFDPKIDHYDLAIHPVREDLADSELICQKLATTPYRLVAAPDLMARIGPCTRPADLEGLRGIGWGADGFMARWRLLGANDETTEINLKLTFSANNLNIIRQAALRGLGLARLPMPMCDADLLDGRLVLPLPDWSPPPVTFYALYPSRRSLTVAGKLFLTGLAKFLQDRLRSSDGRHQSGSTPAAKPKSQRASRKRGHSSVKR